MGSIRWCRHWLLHLAWGSLMFRPSSLAQTWALGGVIYFTKFPMKLSFLKTSIFSLAVVTVALSSAQAAKTDVKEDSKTSATATKAGAATKVPKIFAPYFIKDKPVMGEVGAVVPPKEINKYIAKVQTAAKLNPAWHKEYAIKSKPGLPLPWHENLGLTKDEYDEYLKLWDQRQFKVSQKVFIRLEESKPGEWMIRVSGVGMPITLLRYYTETDLFKSPNGNLKRLEDINASERSILGAWKGQEWSFEEKSDFSWTIENIAVGKFNDGKYCLLIYRIQEKVSSYDKSLLIRFTPPSLAKSLKKK